MNFFFTQEEKSTPNPNQSKVDTKAAFDACEYLRGMNNVTFCEECDLSDSKAYCHTCKDFLLRKVYHT